MPPYNFVSIPQVRSREPLWEEPDLARQISTGQGYLGHAEVKRRETLMTSALHARPEAVIILPGNTWTPFVAAVFTGLFFVGLLAKFYWLAAVGAVLAVGTLFVWAWQGTADGAPDAIPANAGTTLAMHATLLRSPGWWGTLIALLADAALFSSLIFAWFFLWTVSPDWPPARQHEIAPLLPALAFAVLIAGSAAMEWAERGNHCGSLRRLQAGALLAALAGLGFVLLQVTALLDSGIAARAHAYGALVYTINGVQIVHVAVGVLMALFLVLRARAGRLGPLRLSEPAVVRQFWHYTVLQWALGYASIHLFPLLA